MFYVETSPSKQQLYSHLPPITKTIKVRRTIHAGHCWRSRDEFISDVLLLTSSHGRAKVVRPARTYIQQLSEHKGCNPEDLPEAMNDRERWRERVSDIRADGPTRWWWWWLKHLWNSSTFLAGTFCTSLFLKRWKHFGFMFFFFRFSFI